MQRNAQRVFPVDPNERRELAQLFCLALRNLQAYGTDHTVSADTMRSFYDRLVDLLDRYSEITWSHVDGKILLNGESCDLRTADDVLAKRMQACQLETFSFLDCIARIELTRFLAWLATGADSYQTGEAYVGIRISDSVYARISRDALESEEKTSKGQEKGESELRGSESGASTGVKQFDLDSMLSGDLGDMDGAFNLGGSPDQNVEQRFGQFIAQQRAAEEQRRELLTHIQKLSHDPDALQNIRGQFIALGGRPEEWDHLCWEAERSALPSKQADEVRQQQILSLQHDLESLQKRCAMGEYDSESVVQELGKLRGSLNGLMQTVQGQASTLVEKVHADRLHIAKLEQAARDSGAPIHLSREELLESLAEINQELSQPLTVSSALVELLSSGRFGDVDEKQREVFSLATSSLQRLEAVVRYLQRLSGVPVNLSPDARLLSEVYGSGQTD